MANRIPPASARFPDKEEVPQSQINTGRTMGRGMESVQNSVRRAGMQQQSLARSRRDSMTSARDMSSRHRFSSATGRQSKGNAVNVFVRVRPFSQRELGINPDSVSTVQINPEDPSVITIFDPNAARKEKSYSFVQCFWSVFDRNHAADTSTLGAVNKYLNGPTNVMANTKKVEAMDPSALKSYSGAVAVDLGGRHPPYAGQHEVYKHVGKPILDNVLDGFNGCIFAYGQTGSGKTFTMMGYAPSSAQYKKMRQIRAKRQEESLAESRMDMEDVTSDPLFAQLEDDGDDVVDKSHMDQRDLQGIIPRISYELFARLRAKHESDERFSYLVTVSYYEIYKEKVFDLTSSKTGVELKVREHPVKGPFVENLYERGVMKVDDVAKVIHKGLQMRHTNSNMINDYSSRSHAILTMTITLMNFVDGNWKTSTVSKLNLVDLAGSERTGAHGVNIRDPGVPINLSLTALGRVIDFLADLSQGKHSGGVPPYRDTKLTWLLRDSIGGNSRTSMIATISPHESNTQETVQTLLYASRAKEVINPARRNEDPADADVRKLHEYIAELEARLKEGGSHEFSRNYVVDLQLKCNDLQDRCGEQAMTVDRLRAELALGELIDPTAAASNAEEYYGGIVPTVRAPELRREFNDNREKLQSANAEVARLHKELLQRGSGSASNSASVLVPGDVEGKLNGLEKKYNALLSDHRDMDRLLLNYGLYQFNWTVDCAFDALRAKTMALMKACSATMYNRDKNLTTHYSKGQSETLQTISNLNQMHQEELQTMIQRHREALELEEGKRIAQREELERRRQQDAATAETRMVEARADFQRERSRLERDYENMKSQYEDRLADAREEYDGEIAKVRHSVASNVVDRQKVSEEMRAEGELQSRKLKDVLEVLEQTRRQSVEEVQSLRAQFKSELDSKSKEVDEKDRIRRQVELEVATLRRDNIQLMGDNSKREKELQDELRGAAQRQRQLMALCSTVLGDYDANSPGLRSSMDALREHLSSGSSSGGSRPAAASGKAPAAANNNSSSRGNPECKSPSSTAGAATAHDDDLIKRMREQASALKAKALQKEERRIAEMKALQKELYDGMLRNKGMRAPGSADELNQ